jgi:ABC-2 type transport system ATP-binding protein
VADRTGGETTPVLEARGLTKRYGQHTALSGLNLSVAPGEILCLLGANGAGKTTTIQLFLGFLEPSEGEVLVAGRRVSDDVVAARRTVAYIPENVNLYPHLTGVENLAFFTELAGRPRPSRSQLTQWLAEAGLQADAADRKVGAYSKGMRQKVGVAMALAKDADALLLDEPMSGLDPSAAATFCDLLRRLRDRGVGILMTTHNLFRAHDVGDRVGIMMLGSLVGLERTADLELAALEALYLDRVGHGPHALGAVG